MRDLLDILDSMMLTEDVGLANRKPGQTFVNSEGEMITLVDRIVFFPNVGQFDDTDLRDLAIARIEQKGYPIDFVNSGTNQMLAFGVATFNDQDGNIRRYGRYFKSINSVFTLNKWKNSDLPNGFSYNSKAATKMVSGLMPQDVLKFTDKQTKEQVLSQVVEFFKDKAHPLVSLTNGIVKGQPLPIYVDTSKYPDISFEGVRDYFCEILHPIAIINGLTSGNAADAEKAFFGKGGFKSSRVTFDTGKNTGLFDSLLNSSSGKIIKVSSKGGGGAKASIKNLADAIKDLKIAGKQEILSQYADVIELIELIDKYGQADGPLELAKHFEILSEKEAKNVDDMRIAMKTGQEVLPATANLRKIYNERFEASKDQERVIPYFNMLAGIAYKVAEHVNTKTNFGTAAAEILNNSALIQVNTVASHDKKNNKIIIEDFIATYPSTMYSKILFDAKKAYQSTNCKGKFTFGVPTGKDESIPTPSVAAVNKQTAQRVKKAIEPHVDQTPLGSEKRKMRSIPEPVGGRQLKPK